MKKSFSDNFWFLRTFNSFKIFQFYFLNFHFCQFRPLRVDFRAIFRRARKFFAILENWKFPILSIPPNSEKVAEFGQILRSDPKPILRGCEDFPTKQEKDRKSKKSKVGKSIYI